MTKHNRAEELQSKNQERKLGDVKVDLELKSLVSRIRAHASNIKEHVKKQKEQLSDSFVEDSEEDGGGDFDTFSESQNFAGEDNMLLPQILKNINDNIEI